MGKCLFLRKGETHTAPISGILLSDFAEGSIVKIRENGSPVDFYVAKHDYESGLNGTGRTLLVRKDCYDARVWSAYTNGTYNVEYSTSEIDSWLNSTYKNLFDSSVLDLISTTKFYYTKKGYSSKKTLSRSFFLLSAREMGETDSYVGLEGEALPIYSLLKIANYNSSAVNWWLRSHDIENSKQNTVICMYSYGSIGVIGPNNHYYSRPAFTLPSTALFNKNTLILKGVA